MVRTDRVKRTDPARTGSHAEVGRRLLYAARAIPEQGDARHASALPILAVHRVIAHADAVAIHSGGTRSTAAEHAAVLALRRDVLGSSLTDRVAKEIQRVIAEQDKLEYQSYVATLTEARALLDREEWRSVT